MNLHVEFNVPTISADINAQRLTVEPNAEQFDANSGEQIIRHFIPSPVQSVNGKVGDVVLDAADVGALPDDTFIPSKTSDLTNDSGFITGYTETDPVYSASPASGIQSSDITAWNNKSDFSGSYTDLTNKPSIPTKTSDLTNDSGFITTETDPTVPSWAKAVTKPTYTSEEVGAIPVNETAPDMTLNVIEKNGNYDLYPFINSYAGKRMCAYWQWDWDATNLRVITFTHFRWLYDEVPLITAGRLKCYNLVSNTSSTLDMDTYDSITELSLTATDTGYDLVQRLGMSSYDNATRWTRKAIVYLDGNGNREKVYYSAILAASRSGSTCTISFVRNEIDKDCISEIYLTKTNTGSTPEGESVLLSHEPDFFKTLISGVSAITDSGSLRKVTITPSDITANKDIRIACRAGSNWYYGEPAAIPSSVTETDPVFTASTKVQFGIVEVNGTQIIVDSDGNPASFNDIIDAFQLSKGIIIVIPENGIYEGEIVRLTYYDYTTSTIKLSTYTVYNEMLATATEVNNVMTVTNITLRPMECIEAPANASDGDVLVYDGTTGKWTAGTGSGITTETVSGTNPTITAVANHRYICGEVATLSFTPPSSGITDVVFTSGTTATVLTLPSTVTMPEWFVVETNRVYEINIMDGYGTVTSWPVSST